MTEKEIINWLLSIPAEDRMTEFKRLGEESVVAKIIETIVAMTNTDGGIIILGIFVPVRDLIDPTVLALGLSLVCFTVVGMLVPNQKQVAPLSVEN